MMNESNNPNQPLQGEDKSPESSDKNRGQSSHMASSGPPAKKDGTKKKTVLACLIIFLLLGTGLIFATRNDGKTRVAEIDLETSELTLAVNENASLSYKITPVSAANNVVTWSSDNPDVAVVDHSGVVTAVGEGMATITVTTEDGRRTASCVVTVSGISVASLSLNKLTLALMVGESENLLAQITPINATKQGVSWSSSNGSVATVSEDGVVTAMAAGTAVITVISEDSNNKATSTVTVTQSSEVVQPVTGVTLNKSSTTIKKGSLVQLTATVQPAIASNKTVKWTSSNTSVATVSNSGLVTAVAGGTANITVTTVDGGITARCQITVTQTSEATQPVYNIHVNLSSTILDVGDTEQLSATVQPANASNKNVKWTSSNTSVATVSKSGLITAVAEGTATITATTIDGGLTGKCQVTVTQPLVVPSCTVRVEAGIVENGDYTIIFEINAGMMDGKSYGQWDVHFVSISDSWLNQKTFVAQKINIRKHDSLKNAVFALLEGTIDGKGQYVMNMSLRADDEFDFSIGDGINPPFYSNPTDFSYDVNTFMSTLSSGSVIVECDN